MPRPEWNLLQPACKDGQVKSVALGEAELFVERNRARIICENVKARCQPLRLKSLGKSRHEKGRITFAAMIGVDTDTADLDEAIEAHPFAGHGRERPFDTKSDVMAKLNRPRTEGARMGPAGEIQHVGNVG